ncbi:MAG: type II secretion system protein GspM [Burkholderiales bacterium]
MNRSLQRNWIAIALGVALLAVPLLALGLYVLDKHRWAEQRLAEVEPRYARLAGLANSGDALDKADAAARARIEAYAYPAAQDLTQAGNDAQQRARSIFTQAGLQVVSSQVLPAKDEKMFDRIPLAVRLSGELAQLQQALVALSQQTPAILIDAVVIQSFGDVRAESVQLLSGQFNLSVLRAKQ